MFDANVKTTGGYISGKVKIGIILRLLAGGDTLNLGVIFDITSKTCHNMLYEVLLHWVINTGIGYINMKKYLNDEQTMACISDGFSNCSYGILKGAIGATAGWLVRIVRPLFRVNVIKNIVSFFSRKGFYGLNVQIIVDDK